MLFTEEELPARVYLHGNLASDRGGIIYPANDAADGCHRSDLLNDDGSGPHDDRRRLYDDGCGLLDNDALGYASGELNALFFAVENFAGLGVDDPGGDFKVVRTSNVATADDVLQTVAENEFVLAGVGEDQRDDEDDFAAALVDDLTSLLREGHDEVKLLARVGILNLDLVIDGDVPALLVGGYSTADVLDVGLGLVAVVGEGEIWTNE